MQCVPQTSFHDECCKDAKYLPVMCITSHLDFISKRPDDNSDMTIITNAWPCWFLFEQNTLLNATSTVSGAFIPDGKVHHRVQLVPPTPVVRESLEVDDQNAWQ